MSSLVMLQDKRKLYIVSIRATVGMNGLTLMLLVGNLANAKKVKNYRNPGIWVLI